eukprot:CAMPEP_0179005528 /NCGR_PEP_ID=MMETSP0795-20121207/13994_1 /TAXON_ID=88552 /ORGANISM="Amoebophrya sp., Strain Ameob2" /LENGTH=177 /DNA_ID=CAMNT_0020700079 /DNA_START=115 /DNA_END=648 /DNA_ORIENTATION=-
MRLRPAFIYNDESKNEEVFDEEKLQILKEMAEATKKLKKQDKRIKPTTNMEKKHMILEGNWFTYEDSSSADSGEQQDGFDLAESIREGCGLPHQTVPRAAEAAHYLRKEPRKVVDFVRLASSKFKGVLNKRMMEVVQFENLPREGRGMDANEERKKTVASSVTAEKLTTTLAILQTC